MIAAVVRFAVERSAIVLALAGLLVAYGAYELGRAGLDIFPEFSPKQVIIQTEAPGLAAERVEVLITRPVETAVSGVIGVERLRSESIQGLSIVTVVFADDAEPYRIRQLVAERLATLANALPPGTGPPTPLPLSSSSATILTIGVSSQRRSPLELRDHVDAVIVPRLMAVPGVADVNVFGGGERQIQIQPRAGRLRRYGLAITDVVAAARSASDLRGGGFIENANQRLALLASDLPASPEQIERVIVAHASGANVYLGDVATVAFGARPAVGAAQIGGEPGIVMMVIGQYGANTLTVSRAAETALAELRPGLEQAGVTLYGDLFRPANYIETSLRNIGAHLLIGALFVIGVLFLFLFNLRTAFISAVAIPLSLITAVVVLLERGINLNIMVIGGLAIALGEVVDDAIIDTENIFRRLRESRAIAQPQSLAEVVFTASMEVRGSVVYASFIVALVFVPLLTLTGVTGRLFAPLGVSYILAILASLLVALTVTPALCYLLLARAGLSAAEPPVIRAIRVPYGAWLRRAAPASRAAVVTVLVVCGIGVAAVPTLDSRFLPDLREGHYMVHTATAAGTSLAESLRVGTRLTEEFARIDGVRSVSQWAGRAERGADTFGSHYSEYEVDLDPLPGGAQQRVLDGLRAVLGAFPGVLYETETFLTERVNETISGYTSPVVINLYGTDLGRLDAVALQLAGLLGELDGAAAVQVRSPPGTPLLHVAPRSEALARFGLTPLAVADTVQAAFEGVRTGQAQWRDTVIDIAVLLPPAERRTVEQVRDLPLRAADGTPIRLEDVAEVREQAGRYSILHQGAQRVQTVTAHIVGRDYDAFMAELRRRVGADIDLGADVHVAYTGAGVEQAEARAELIVHSIVAGVGVLLLAYLAVGSIRHVVIMLLNLPFALVGGVIAALVTGGVVSVGSMVGFVTLFGITIRNSIMLVSHYRHLVEVDGLTWDLATAVRGAEERLPSILMTALVTALAMLPIAIDSDNPGREIMGPMAAIIIGGLISSTVLNLALLPALMLRFGRFARLAG